MTTRDPTFWMWAGARQALDRAEQLHRSFFGLAGSRAGAHSQPCWEPPADIFETDAGLFIEVALPGVDAGQVEASFDGAALMVVGERKLPRISESAVIRRMEIPYGRFERRIPLPSGLYELTRREIVDGCLVLWLQKRP